jgi:hypothetical protein
MPVPLLSPWPVPWRIGIKCPILHTLRVPGPMLFFLRTRRRRMWQVAEDVVLCAVALRAVTSSSGRLDAGTWLTASDALAAGAACTTVAAALLALQQVTGHCWS